MHNFMKLLWAICLSTSLYDLGLHAQTQTALGSIQVPIEGNTYVTEGNVARRHYADKVMARWADPKVVYSTYFRTSQAGKMELSIRYSAKADSKIKVSCLGKSFQVKLKAGENQAARIGSVATPDTGYVKVNLQGLERKGDTFGELTTLSIQGPAVQGTVHFVNDFSSYWGRRGPSVHINYPFPEGETIEWFYNEVTVPLDGGPLATYYMSNGFGEGYFGMQINSATERRVLFSVWSPFTTDDPKAIPESHQIKMLRKGEDVKTGEFGNEGSGGQSYLIYPWKTGNTYKFLTRIHPDGNGSTVYTSYFYATDENRWRLIASFSRPLTETYYTRAHSFLEDFDPETGAQTRRAYYGNQWARTISGEWIELTKNARFTVDETGRKGARMDYKGGVEGHRFFLQNCGFFNDYTAFGSIFEREAAGRQPVIDFDQLP